MAADDHCSAANFDAWYVLGELDDPLMPELARKRLAATPPPKSPERRNIAYGLVSSFVPAAMGLLESMRDDPSSEVQPLVRVGLDPKREMDKLFERIGAAAHGPISAAERDRRVRALEEGARTGVYKMEERMETFVPCLTVEDIPLIDRTRAAILHQLTEDARPSLRASHDGLA